ncbi:MAG TPA: nucleotide exchange factor GrpE [Acidobacteriota bacterium]|nr:nucleotide exchange factor GrpE [Acidobacteriota bacterium]
MVDEKDELDKESPEDGTSHGNGKDQDGSEINMVDLEVAGAAAEEPAAQESAELEMQLEALRTEKGEIYERLLRKQADFENFRKRIEKEKREFMAYSLQEFVLELLPILDNFERALAHPEDQGGADYRKGVELIYRQFRDLMEKRGLRAIETTGRPFDPNFHEAILREERNDLPENTILAELQKGYFFRDKLLRPAMVKVSFRTAEAEEDPEIEIIDVE